MKLTNYLKDKISIIIITIISIILITLLDIAFKVPEGLIIVTIVLLLLTLIVALLISYFQKRTFYNTIITNTKNLDKKYLVLETIPKPNTYEEELIYNIMCDINKSMIENVSSYINSTKDFKEYIEMWIHEVKIPISSLTLLNHNHQNSIDKMYVEQIKRLDNYIDQILYYVRSENAEKDYIITEKNLQDIIKNVALKNKDDLLENNVKLEVDVNNKKVLTDSKWLEFILNQIINNSIKYKRNNVDSYIKIIADEDKDKIFLSIYDNGIGIPENDLSRVFEKSFTGENGRMTAKSTGMGLYIVKKLCNKLGHKVYIESKQGEYTKITIIFSKNDFYKLKD